MKRVRRPSAEAVAAGAVAMAAVAAGAVEIAADAVVADAAAIAATGAIAATAAIAGKPAPLVEFSFSGLRCADFATEAVRFFQHRGIPEIHSPPEFFLANPGSCV